MAASLLGLSLLLASSPASAEQRPGPLPASPVPLTQSPSLTGLPPGVAEETLFFRKEPNRAAQGRPVAPLARPAAAPARMQRINLLQPEDRKPPTPDVEDTTEYKLQLDPPSPDRLFRLESERSMRERMRQEARAERETERIEFPVEPTISTEPYTPRQYPPKRECTEPYYVCYKKLLFEQVNSERYGWDLGIYQPLLSTGIFYYDMALLPYHTFTRPCECHDCSAGYCLPDDPVPLLLYPEELSLTGALAEAGTVAALFAIFP